MKKMLILAFFIVVESRLTDGKYECFDCMLTIERNKTVEQRGGPCLPPSIYEEPLTDRMHKGEIKETITTENKTNLSSKFVNAVKLVHN